MSTDQISVLDHGYLKLVESWGSDERIIEAARMSTGKGFKGWKGDECTCFLRPYLHCKLDHDHYPECSTLTGPYPNCPNCGETGKLLVGDEKLLSYLYTHKHHTPFEMCGVTIEVQAPIFVFREWHRHRTQSYNEMSARYTPLPDLNYVPSLDRVRLSDKNNKQSVGVTELDENSIEGWREELQDIYQEAEMLYQAALNRGIPKELARLCLPVARYSRMRASANLRNWLGFLTLRMAPNAQYEIRMYANTLHDVLVGLFPRTMELFDAKT